MARPFVWTPGKKRAVELIQEGQFSQARIADELVTTRRIAEGWARRPAFRERLRKRSQARMHRWMAAWKRKLTCEAAA